MYWRKAAIGLILLALSIFLGDQLLGLMGFPSGREIQVSHPKNFYERRKTAEFEVDFRTNSQGLRYKEIPLEKPSGEQRVLVLGDQFTEGVGVEEDETFSAHLENYFSGGGEATVRFINGGLSGTGPLQYWRFFYRVGIKYNPDIILISLYANDVYNTPKVKLTLEDLYTFYTGEYETKKPGIRKTLHRFIPRIYTMLSQLKDQLLDVEVQTPIRSSQYSVGNKQKNFIEKVIQEAKLQGISDDDITKWKESLDSGLVKAVESGDINGALLSYPLLKPHYYRTAIDIDTAESELQFQAMTFVLNELRSVAEANGIQVWLIYIPSRWQYDPGAYESLNVLGHDHPWLRAEMVRESWLDEQSEIQKRLEQWAQQRAVPFLDLTASFREKANDGVSLTYRLDDDNVLNSTGHVIAATTIRQKILEKYQLKLTNRVFAKIANC